MLMPYRTTLGTSAVTYGVHDATTGEETAEPIAATAGAVTASLRHFTSGDITGPAIVRWYEDDVQVADEYVPPDTQAAAAAAIAAADTTPEILASIEAHAAAPVDGALITPLTKGVDELPLGRVQPDAEMHVYLAGVFKWKFDADADGDYSFKLPLGSTWTITSSAPLYRPTTMEVTT